MKLLNRLRDLRSETITEHQNSKILDSDKHQDFLGVGATTTDDILRLKTEDIRNTNLDH